MHLCKLCPWYRRLFCLVACDEVSRILDEMDRTLKGEGR